MLRYIAQNKVRDFIKEKHLSWMFLPQYAPELAPVELFFCQLKKSITTRRTSGAINLEKEPGRLVIANLIASIDNVAIIKIWSHFISKLKQLIGEIGSILDQNR